MTQCRGNFVQQNPEHGQQSRQHVVQCVKSFHFFSDGALLFFVVDFFPLNPDQQHVLKCNAPKSAWRPSFMKGANPSKWINQHYWNTNATPSTVFGNKSGKRLPCCYKVTNLHSQDLERAQRVRCSVLKVIRGSHNVAHWVLLCFCPNTVAAIQSYVQYHASWSSVWLLSWAFWLTLSNLEFQ